MLKARDIMTKEVVTIGMEAPILEAMKVLLDNDITGLPVVEEKGLLVGVVSEKDMLRLYRSGDYAKEKKVKDFMTQPAVYFEDNENLDDICKCLVDSEFRRVPVTSMGKVIGIISRPDILKCIVESVGERADAIAPGG